jgi:hypothetical protein
MTDTDIESDEETTSCKEPIYVPNQHSTTDRQGDYFQHPNPNRLPQQAHDTQLQHFKYLPIQGKTYVPKQKKAATSFMQRHISGWLL